MARKSDLSFIAESSYQTNMRAAGPKAADQVKLLTGGVAFVFLTVGVFWYHFSRIQPSDAVPQWDKLQWSYLFLMLICLPVDAFVCGLRMWVVCRVFESGVSFWTCLKAECANMGVAMLTPSQSGGGFGQIYMLSHGGLKVGTALTISLITFLGSMVALLWVGLYALLISRFDCVGTFFYSAIGFFTFILVVMILSLIWPGLFRIVVAKLDGALGIIITRRNPFHKRRLSSRDSKTKKPARISCLAIKLTNLIDTYQRDARWFLKRGKADFGIVCLLSLVFIVSRSTMAFLCLRFLGIQGSTLFDVIEIQLAVTFLIYFAPTPGGSAIAEVISCMMMAEIISPGFFPYYNLLWRGSILYIPAIAGLVWVLQAIMQDVHRVVAKKRYKYKCLRTSKLSP